MPEELQRIVTMGNGAGGVLNLHCRKMCLVTRDSDAARIDRVFFMTERLITDAWQ